MSRIISTKNIILCLCLMVLIFLLFSCRKDETSPADRKSFGIEKEFEDKVKTLSINDFIVQHPLQENKIEVFIQGTDSMVGYSNFESGIFESSLNNLRKFANTYSKREFWKFGFFHRNEEGIFDINRIQLKQTAIEPAVFKSFYEFFDYDSPERYGRCDIPGLLEFLFYHKYELANETQRKNNNENFEESEVLKLPETFIIITYGVANPPGFEKPESTAERILKFVNQGYHFTLIPILCEFDGSAFSIKLSEFNDAVKKSGTHNDIENRLRKTNWTYQGVRPLFFWIFSTNPDTPKKLAKELRKNIDISQVISRLEDNRIIKENLKSISKDGFEDYFDEELYEKIVEEFRESFNKNPIFTIPQSNDIDILYSKAYDANILRLYNEEYKTSKIITVKWIDRKKNNGILEVNIASEMEISPDSIIIEKLDAKGAVHKKLNALESLDKKYEYSEKYNYNLKILIDKPENRNDQLSYRISFIQSLPEYIDILSTDDDSKAMYYFKTMYLKHMLDMLVKNRSFDNFRTTKFYIKVVN